MIGLPCGCRSPDRTVRQTGSPRRSHDDNERAEPTGRWGTGRRRIARIDTEGDVAVVKIDVLTIATGTAMGGVIRVAQVQRQLEALVAEAAGRLALLADDHLLAMGETLADLRRNPRR